MEISEEEILSGWGGRGIDRFAASTRVGPTTFRDADSWRNTGSGVIAGTIFWLLHRQIGWMGQGDTAIRVAIGVDNPALNLISSQKRA